MKKLYKIAGIIHAKTIENQGCSMNLDGLTPISGYMVGISGHELQVNILDFTSGHVDGYIRAKLGILYNRNMFIGTWINNDIVFIDISTNIQDKIQALKCAKIEHQICIWDVEKKVEIYQLEEVI